MAGAKLSWSCRSSSNFAAQRLGCNCLALQIFKQRSEGRQSRSVVSKSHVDRGSLTLTILNPNICSSSREGSLARLGSSRCPTCKRGILMALRCNSVTYPHVGFLHVCCRQVEGWAAAGSTDLNTKPWSIHASSQNN